MIKTVVIATSNPDKVEEINDIAADSGIEFICAPEKFNAVENGETFAENAYIKAREGIIPISTKLSVNSVKPSSNFGCSC